MAKKAKEKTAAQKSLDDARQKLELANTADTTKNTDATKKAVETAKANVKAADDIVRRERFVLIGGSRTKKARLALRNVAAVAAPRSYAYTEADIATFEATMTKEVQSAAGKLRTALTKGGVAKAEIEDIFSA